MLPISFRDRPPELVHACKQVLIVLLSIITDGSTVQSNELIQKDNINV